MVGWYILRMVTLLDLRSAARPCRIIRANYQGTATDTLGAKISQASESRDNGPGPDLDWLGAGCISNHIAGHRDPVVSKDVRLVTNQNAAPELRFDPSLAGFLVDALKHDARLWHAMLCIPWFIEQRLQTVDFGQHQLKVAYMALKKRSFAIG